MGIRRTVGSRLEAVLGRDRTNAIRGAERRARTALAQRLAMPASPKVQPEPAPKPGPPKPAPPKPAPPKPAPPKPAPPKPAHAPGRAPSDPFVPHPRATMSRHQMMRRLHALLQPRTYLEIGVADGASLTLSRARSIGVDPGFHVEKAIACDLQLVRSGSDAFFASTDPMAHLQGVPVDFAFIDGMHLSDFALRDFFNTEPFMAGTGVVVIDDVLPRNGLEAARDRRTKAWTGDVYKAVEILLRRRSDLIVVLVNTAPTGTAIVCRLDPASRTLRDAYSEDEPYLVRADPQTPPQAFMDRSLAVDAEQLLASPIWPRLVALRDSGRPVDDEVWADLRNLKLPEPEPAQA